jgi:hypothetical protein
MSRSYRKPWIKEHQRNLSNKTIHNRRERRIIRQLVKPWKVRYNENWLYEINLSELYEFPNGWTYEFSKLANSPIEPPLPSRREMTDTYDISDYRFPWTDPQGYRK